MEQWSVGLGKRQKILGQIVKGLILGVLRWVIIPFNPITPLLHFSSIPILIEGGCKDEYRGI
jgi:hypothetical protein